MLSLAKSPSHNSRYRMATHVCFVFALDFPCRTGCDLCKRGFFNESWLSKLKLPFLSCLQCTCKRKGEQQMHIKFIVSWYPRQGNICFSGKAWLASFKNWQLSLTWMGIKFKLKMSLYVNKQHILYSQPASSSTAWMCLWTTHHYILKKNKPKNLNICLFV